MIRLPEIPSFKGGAIDAPAVRVGAAAAPAEALGGLGEALVGVSHHFQDTALQLQKLENGRVVAEKRNRLAEDFAGHQLEIQKDLDPVSRIKRTQDFLSDYKGRLTDDTMPPAVRDELGQHFDHFATQAVIQQGEESARLGLQRAGAALKNEYGGALDRGDMAGVEQAIRTGQASGAILPEEADGMRRQASETLAARQAEQEIAGDPAGWQARNPADKIPAGVNPDIYRRQQALAKGQLRDQTLGAQETILNGIADGSLDTGEKIRAAAGTRLGAADVADLQQRLALRDDTAEKQRLARPEVQAQTIGAVSAAIQSMEPDDLRGQLAIQAGIHSLPAGELKKRLNGEFAAKLRGDTAEAETYADYVMGQLGAAHAAGRFGETRKPDGLSTRQLMQDGFLQDTGKLERLGFSTKKAEKIAKAAASNPALGQTLFIAEWKARPQGSVNANPIEIAAADALRNGNATLSGWDDPASAAAVKEGNATTAQRYGLAKMKMAEFLKLNPKASKEEIDQRFLKITGEGIKAEVKRKLVDDKPGRIDPSTSAIPKGGVKLSNYGYPSDSTPDRNSSKGIGHSNNKLVAGESAAISKSLADRLGVVHGDKLKIETTKGTFTVFYHDTVPSTDSRTGDLPETIDIYRPTEGTNDWGGRVTKVTKI